MFYVRDYRTSEERGNRMTDNEKLSCLIDRPCNACKFHKEEGCSKWSCVFEEKSGVPKGEYIKKDERYRKRGSMSDTVKLIIEIPKTMYDNVQSGTYCGTLYKELKNGIPLEDVKAEIEKKCDRINSIASVLSYPQHREIQELLCEILDTIGKAES